MPKPSHMGNVLAVAHGLISEDGDNPEYDRAITEMTCELLGLPITDNRDMVAELIRAVTLD